MAVKAALTYEISEAANALGKTPATIRNWIKDGLPVMSSRKPYLLSGSAIREYLQLKYKTAKRPLEPDQFYCPSCRKGRKPLDMAATLVPLTKKTLLMKGVCGRCGSINTRMISTSKVSAFSKTFDLTEGGNSRA